MCVKWGASKGTCRITIAHLTASNSVNFEMLECPMEPSSDNAGGGGGAEGRKRKNDSGGINPGAEKLSFMQHFTQMVQKPMFNGFIKVEQQNTAVLVPKYELLRQFVLGPNSIPWQDKPPRYLNNFQTSTWWMDWLNERLQTKEESNFKFRKPGQKFWLSVKLKLSSFFVSSWNVKRQCCRQRKIFWPKTFTKIV